MRDGMGRDGNRGCLFFVTATRVIVSIVFHFVVLARELGVLGGLESVVGVCHGRGVQKIGSLVSCAFCCSKMLLRVTLVDDSLRHHTASSLPPIL